MSREQRVLARAKRRVWTGWVPAFFALAAAATATVGWPSGISLVLMTLAGLVAFGTFAYWHEAEAIADHFRRVDAARATPPAATAN